MGFYRREIVLADFVKKLNAKVAVHPMILPLILLGIALICAYV